MKHNAIDSELAAVALLVVVLLGAWRFYCWRQARLAQPTPVPVLQDIFEQPHWESRIYG